MWQTLWRELKGPYQVGRVRGRLRGDALGAVSGGGDELGAVSL